MGKRIILFLCCAVGMLLLAAPSAMAAISLSSIQADHAYAGDTFSGTVYGTFHFPAGTHVWLPNFQLTNGPTTINFAATSLNVTGEKASVSFAIPRDAALGSYTLVASQHYEIWVGFFWLPQDDWITLPGAFTVQEHPPVITSLNPASVLAGGGNLTLTVYGDFFYTAIWGHPKVFFDGVDYGASTTFNSETVVTAIIPAAAVATPRSVNVVVNNPYLFIPPGVSSAPYAFTITAPTPTITALDPSSAVVGGPAFSLGVTGTNFVTGATGAVVRWNGVDLATTRDSPTHLTAAVPAANLAAAAGVSITVRNGTALAAPVSNSLPFTVGNAPALTSLSPTQVWAGYVKNDLVLTVNGSNFVNGARIVLSGGEKTGTTFVNATQLTVPLVAADISTAATLTVSVRNPPFPPGTSSAGALPLAVVAETTDPTVTIGGADSAWHKTPVALTFTPVDSQSGVQKVQYQSPPTVSSWTDGVAYTVPTSTEGPIPVSVQALDWCNRIGTASATVNIDTTKPETEALNNASVKRRKTANLKFRISEPADLSPSAKVVIKVKRSNGTTATTITIPAAPMNAQQTASFKCTLAKGTYKWYVYATDLAGNTQDNIAQATLKVK